MIAVDTSAISAFLTGEENIVVEKVAAALQANALTLPPLVIAELLSSPAMTRKLERVVLGIPLLPITQSYWERVGTMRRKILAKSHKARIADCQIAMSCIDNEVPIIACDKDFRHFCSFGLRFA